MATSVKREKFRFTDGLIDYLQEVDYRPAVSDQDKENIFKFRYSSYLRDNSIDASASKRLSDDYDKMDNCWIFGIDYENVLASSIRIHIATKDKPRSPTLDVFPDIVGPLLEDGYKVVDPTRFVSDSSTTNYFPVLPLLTFRLACMASDYFDADYLLIPVSVAHSTFYQRMFGLSPVAEPRYYPKLKTPICLFRANVAEQWDSVIEEYPVFRSTFTERRMLFERPVDIATPDRDSIQDKVARLNKPRLN